METVQYDNQNLLTKLKGVTKCSLLSLCTIEEIRLRCAKNTKKKNIYVSIHTF